MLLDRARPSKNRGNKTDLPPSGPLCTFRPVFLGHRRGLSVTCVHLLLINSKKSSVLLGCLKYPRSCYSSVEGLGSLLSYAMRKICSIAM